MFGGWKAGPRSGAVLRLVVGVLVLLGLGTGSRHWRADAGMQAIAGVERVKAAVLKAGDPLPELTGPVVLTVHVPRPGGGESTLRFDVDALERLGTARYRSRNRWYPHPVTYEGVLGSVFLDYVHPPAGLNSMKLRALNDYVVHIPVSDFRRWPVLLATRLDGRRMPVREKGPIWVVYPSHLFPELAGPLHEDKWIWQLTEIWFESRS